MVSILKVEGMGCDHCVKRIIKVINDIDGVKAVEVSLPNKTVKVEYVGNIYNNIEEAIKEEGYEVEK